MVKSCELSTDTFSFSIVENFAVGGGAVGVHGGLQPGVAHGLNVTREQSSAVQLKERLEEVSAARLHDLLDLVVARIVEEALVVQVGLVELDRAAIVAKHELLERHEAHVPRVTLFIGHKARD